MTDHQAYDEAIAAVQHAKDNGLRFLVFADSSQDKFTMVALCSPAELACYIRRLLGEEELSKVVLKECVEFVFEKMADGL